MIAIELKRILKDAALILVVLAALVVAIMASDQDVYLAPALEIFLLLNASFLGWSMFERERQENATEYMLTLPVSRTRLLGQKVLPRLAAAALLLLAYFFLHQRLLLPSFLSPKDFAILFAAFFFLSLSFSLSLKNVLSAFFLACLLLVGQVLLIMEADNSRGLPGVILQASLTVTAFPILFYALFQGFDIRPVSQFNKKLLPVVLALACAIAGAVWFFKPAVWNNYYLARDGTVIRNSCRRSEILPRPPGSRIAACLIPLRETEEGGSVFAMTHKPQKGKRCLHTGVVSLHLKSGALKSLYRIPAGWFVVGGYPGEIGTILGDAYLLLLYHPVQKKARVLVLEDGGTRTIPLPCGPLDEERIGYVGFLRRDPLSLLVVETGRSYMLFGDGRRLEIATAEKANVWRDRVLVFTPEGMKLIQAGATPLPLWENAGQFRKVLRNVGGYESRFVLYRSGGKYFALDMERPVAGAGLEMRSTPFTYQETDSDLFAVIFSGPSFDIWRWRDGRAERHAWEVEFSPVGVRVSPFGVLAFDRQRYKVHPFKKD